MSDEDRVKAGEPTKDGGGDATAGGSVPHGVAAPADSAAQEDGIDDATAGDGVQFFEGGDGREEARTDMERGG